ncbi:MAG: hypothetical protein COA73_06215 [Candidatus Hydrogenedentota bacterium]|nr:MAG: hypothetical protein COA73_06215 [Candidatus Hydrogenedentota bacterium]
MKKIVRILCTAMVLLMPITAQAESYHVILCGSGGDAEYYEKFQEWGTRLLNVLSRFEGNKSDHIYLLMEPVPGSEPSDSSTDLENIETVFATLAEKTQPGDDVYVYLIGHGSYFKSVPKLHIPGPDLSVDILNDHLNALPAARIVIINAASSSAPFINALSKPGRVICTATKSATEVNATDFMEFFLQSMEDDSADMNKDERISILEVCQQAAELTAAWYISEGLLASEHALLDDNGDGQGSRLSRDMMDDTFAVNPALMDGQLAATFFLKEYSFPENAPAELIQEYLEALDTVREVKEKKNDLTTTEYYDHLEEKLLKAARLNRDIRAYGDSHDSSS